MWRIPQHLRPGSRYLLQRLLSAMGVVLGVSLLVFLLLRVVPGDPVEVMLGESAPAADREALRHSLGLDLPIPMQLAQYLSGLPRLDLGISLQSRTPVAELLSARLPATAALAGAALAIAVILSFPLGVLAAVRKDTAWDHATMSFALLGLSMPAFWLGPVLILVFALWLGWLPVSGREQWSSIVLPALTLGVSMAAILARMVRSTLLEVLEEDYIRTATAKGLSPRIVIWRHGLRNALLPVITLLGLQLGTLLGGAVITEIVFSWPGIGSLMIESIQRRDYPVVQGCVLVIGTAYVFINLATDLVYALVDPRVRPDGGS